MKRMLWLCALMFGVFSSQALAQGSRDYTEGEVTQVASIKVTPGHLDQYTAYLASTWTKEQAALKEAGVITDYRIYLATPRRPDDPDIYLVTTYANMAALDGLDDRSDAVTAKALGSTREKDMKGMADRNSYREIVGIELIRELKFK
ncbi:MAG TPA: hypothetical protein VND91_13090 [Candidatus Saccharimonadia bacterium]|nr:hypothetical protein [Candidatus Saccharimonadia bacterium]